MSEFKWGWTDALAMEYARQVAKSYANSQVWTGDYVAEEELMKRFKASKQPKPEWEILSFKVEDIYGKGSTTVVDKNNEWFSIATIVKNPIYSVKRLSDGEVFTVGDVVSVGENFYGPIKCFDLPFTGALCVWFHSGLPVVLKEVYHCKQIPVLLTPSEIEKLKTLLNG